MAAGDGRLSLEEAIKDKCGCEEKEDRAREDLPAMRLVKEAAVYLRPGECSHTVSVDYLASHELVECIACV